MANATPRACAAKSALLLLYLMTIHNCGGLFPAAEAVWFSLPPSGTKCVSEEVHNGAIVLAHYFVIYEYNPQTQSTISSRVTSPYGNTVHRHENVTHGDFAFTSQETGSYLACFWVDSGNLLTTPINLSLDWKTGISAKDWDSVVKKEKIEGVELQLRRLEGLVQAIHENLNYLKGREVEMREISEKTNSRVAWFSSMSLGTCILVSVLQILHLKRFFHKKKLI